MKNLIQDGEVLTIAAPSGGVTSGQLVIVGSIAGIAVATAAETVPVALAVQGVFLIPKATGAALTVGAKVYSNAGAAVTTTDTHTYVGVVTKAAASGDTTVEVLLAY